MTTSLDVHQRTLGRNAAILIVIGLLTGIVLSAAMTKKIDAEPSMVLAAHLNGLLGCFWMIAVAWSLPALKYGEVGRSRLVWLVTVPNFANWGVTLFKSFWKVSGVDRIGEFRNDTIFGLLTLSVVLPSLAAAGAWAWGFIGVKP